MLNWDYMNKGLTTILAVAIIGTLGIYSKNHSKTGATLGSGNPAVAASSTNNTNANTTQPSSSTGGSGLKNGTYEGETASTSYGPVQIAIVVSGGLITDVNFLQMPSDLPHSQEVTSISAPILKQETLYAQNANIDFVSGATSTSFGYEQSLQAALDQAKLG